jgi:hypothetical protein
MGTGEPVVIKKPALGEPVVLEDFVELPPVPMPAGVSEKAEIELSFFALPQSEAIPGRQPALPGQGPAPAQATEAQDQKVAGSAQQNVGLDTSKARGTNGGRLACAWA